MSEEIPLLARISSIAGTYDALTSQRVYKPALSKSEALHLVRERAGTYYDPKIVNVFLDMMNDE